MVPLLRRDTEGVLRAPVVLGFLMEQYPERIRESHLRTLQRRMREWRVLEGPGKEVMFEQEHPPGQEGAFDFTHATKLGVTIRGVVLVHLLFVFRLSHSGWTFAQVAYGETYEALIKGLQDALWRLGGVPARFRHDNLSAATRELKRSGGRALTTRFAAFLDHFSAESSRIRPGRAHENGIAEKANDIVLRALSQALVLRGSSDFDSVSEYQDFILETIDRRILAGIGDALEQEKALLRPLPSSRVPTYTSHDLKVRSTSVIRLSKRTYSVPSNLIGQRVQVRQHPDEIEVYFAGRRIERMPRLRGDASHRIDYRHVAWSLMRKPGAFAGYRYREELFPTVRFRLTWDLLQKWRDERSASLEYVRILHLAASRMESEVDAALSQLIDDGEPFDYVQVRALCEPAPISVPRVSIPEPDLLAYDEHLEVVR